MGLAQYFTKGEIIYSLAPLLNYLGGEYIGIKDPARLPVVILVGAVVLLIGHFVLTYTKFGRYVYMTGSNREAARLSGINTKVIVGVSLMISSFCAGLAGMLNTGRLGRNGAEILRNLYAKFSWMIPMFAANLVSEISRSVGNP